MSVIERREAYQMSRFKAETDLILYLDNRGNKVRLMLGESLLDARNEGRRK